MRRIVLLAILAMPIAAQAQPGAGQQNPSSVIAPRSPDGHTSGTMPRDRGRMDNTVDQIDRKLLNEEKDRPSIPGQAPSPSQNLPGGSGPPPSSNASPR